MAIEVSNGTRRGRRTGVRDPDGIGVKRLQGDRIIGDARMFDERVADSLEEITKLLRLVYGQLRDAGLGEGEE